MRLTHLEDSWILVNGLPVLVRQTKRGDRPDAPVLIHLHGVGMSGTYMLPAADALAGEFRTNVPDLPGFGRSVKTGIPPTVEGLATSTRDVMDALSVDRATLIGNSMGCMTVLEFAHRYPERIDRAILCSPGRPVYQPLARGIWQITRLIIEEPIGMLPILIHDYVRSGARDLMSLYRSMGSYPTSRRFLQLTVPTLILRGSRDPFVTERELSRYVARPGGGITAASIPGAGHTMNYSHPVETAAAIRAFLRPTGQGSAIGL
ncbi:MAG: alpha/beta fold hydrolase [Thermomicrobiales bacterium]